VPSLIPGDSVNSILSGLSANLGLGKNQLVSNLMPWVGQLRRAGVLVGEGKIASRGGSPVHLQIVLQPEPLHFDLFYIWGFHVNKAAKIETTINNNHLLWGHI
jgi:hypothetical protein